MVDPINRIRSKVCRKENYQREYLLDFCAENAIEGKDGGEDFLYEDILDIELGHGRYISMEP